MSSETLIKVIMKKEDKEIHIVPKSRPIDINVSTSLPSSPKGKKPIKIDDTLQTAKVISYIEELLSKISLPNFATEKVDDSFDPFEATATSLGMLTFNEIANHLISIRLDHIQKLLRPLLHKTMTNQRNASIFTVPVDAVALGIPEYLNKIKKPMDLGTVRRRLLSCYYSNVVSCIADIALVFKNAMTFNAPSNGIHKLAKEIKNDFESDLQNLEEKCVRDMERKATHSCQSCSGSACPLCGEKCQRFDPPTLVCHGTCMQRIKRNSTYFVTDDGTMTWCQKCHSALPQVVVDNAPKPPLLKRQLLKRKFDEETSEPWIFCDCCGHWMHQICALYSELVDTSVSEKETKFKCPLCRLESAAERGGGRAKAGLSTSTSSSDIFSVAAVSFEKQSSGISSCKTSPPYGSSDHTSSDSDHENDSVCKDSMSKASMEDPFMDDINDAETDKESHTMGELLDIDHHSHWRASSLPRSRLSDFMEAMVAARLADMGYADIVPSITIRMTSNLTQHMEVPDSIFMNMMTASGLTIPQYLSYKQKCILLFQNINGIDVCLFCLYVHEFDEASPEPNNSIVYIAYLDSVDYFRPIEARSAVYHEILVAYLKWVQARGFKQGHIWSCPPQRGDNFIFWNHPPHQKTPSRDRLNAWYTSILQRASSLNTFKDVSNLYSAYFTQKIYSEVSRVSSSFSFEEPAAVSAQPSKSPAVTPQSNFALSFGYNAVNEKVPVCPPLFDGDFFVNECARLYKVAQSRAKGVDGFDKVVNLRKARELLKHLMSKRISNPFNQPVDADQLKLADYFNVIKEPMDLGTVREKLRASAYMNILQFASDVRLTFQNAIRYNPPANHVHLSAKALISELEQSLLDLATQYAGESVDLCNMDQLLATYPLVEIAAPVSPRGKSASLVTALAAVTPSSARDSLECDASSKSSNSPEVLSDRDDDEASDHETTSDRVKMQRSMSIDSVVSESVSVESYGRPMARQSLSANLSASMLLNIKTCRERSGRPFDKPELGYRGAMSMMVELSKSTQRLKDDLFVFKFSALDERGLSCLPAVCQAMLRDVRPDTSDPDHSAQAPFVDSRHTFLEMCQFRHYQFDTLRRAKHSSIMLLYHLHNPTAKHLQLSCSKCKTQMSEVRWHCDCCPGYDICGDCYAIGSKLTSMYAVSEYMNPVHHHHLTPYRVTYYVDENLQNLNMSSNKKTKSKHVLFV